jgi:hypothetical protein
MKDPPKVYRTTLLIIDGTGYLHRESEISEPPGTPVHGSLIVEFIGGETTIGFEEEISDEQLLTQRVRN